MKGVKISSCSFIIYLMIYDVYIVASAADQSKVYNVGDSENWNTGVNYLSWLQKYNFIVGDTLVFNYVKGQHNTCEVTQATYQSCNSSSGVLVRYESGNDRIVLNEAKKYWFVCDIPGHCAGGMRFAINVKNVINGNATTLPPYMDQNNAMKRGDASSLVYYLPALLAFVIKFLA